jgi:hypothetical protein
VQRLDWCGKGSPCRAVIAGGRDRAFCAGWSDPLPRVARSVWLWGGWMAGRSGVNLGRGSEHHRERSGVAKGRTSLWAADRDGRAAAEPCRHLRAGAMRGRAPACMWPRRDGCRAQAAGGARGWRRGCDHHTGYWGGHRAAIIWKGSRFGRRFPRTPTRRLSVPAARVAPGRAGRGRDLGSGPITNSPSAPRIRRI